MRLRLDEDGIVELFTGQMPHGQGHQTTLAQIAADEFGVPFEQVRVVVGDSSVVPFGLTGGSRSATMTGGVALHGARDLKAKVLDFAAGLMEASPQDLLITDGNVWVQGDPDSAMAVSEVARRAAAGQFEAGVGVELEVVATYDGGQGGWSGGTHAAIVDVDVETGIVKVERYIAVEDCGALINPAIVEGQIRGGVAQGIGAVLLERSVYAEDGNYVSATFMDYLMPTACDVPRIEIEHLRDGAARRRRQLPRRGRRRHDRGAAHAGERHRGRTLAVRGPDLRAASASGSHPGAHCRGGPRPVTTSADMSQRQHAGR